MRGTLLLGLIALLALAAPAAASSVDASGGIILVHETEDEDNRITFGVQDGRIIVRDAGAPIRAQDDCVQRDANSVSCVMPERQKDIARGDELIVHAQDGDDVVDASGVSGVIGDIHLDGSFGDDVLIAGTALPADAGDYLARVIEGGPGRDLITGSPAGDNLFGGDGADVVRALAGDDDLSGESLAYAGTVDRDVLDGGPGEDTADYEPRGGPIGVDLTKDVGGKAGEDDQLIDVENARGGRGRNLLIGDAGDNILYGASPGSTCGDGHDVIRPKVLRKFPLIPDDCERVLVGNLETIGPALLPKRKGIWLRVFIGRYLRGRIDFQVGGTVVARAKLRPETGRFRYTIRAKLTRAGKRKKLAGKTVRVVFRTRGYEKQGFRATMRRLAAAG